jgi:hypothetical protein
MDDRSSPAVDPRLIESEQRYQAVIENGSRASGLTARLNSSTGPGAMHWPTPMTIWPG